MTMKLDWLRGTATALVTPFLPDGAIDERTFVKLVDRQIKGGVKLLVPCGTTGENVTMTADEQLTVIKLTVETARKRGAKVIAGTGTNNTAAAIELTRRAREAGADAALIVTPYYNRPTQEGLFSHYSEIARSVRDLPIVLYNVPGRTSVNISAGTTLRLADAHCNIVGTKEASGNYSQIMEIIAGRPKNFKVFSGDDSSAIPLIALGAEGLVSVCSNELPGETVKMVDHALNGSFHFARKLHYRLLPLMEANFIESSPAPCKFVMKEMGLCGDRIRLPLVPISPSAEEVLREALKKAKKAKK